VVLSTRIPIDVDWPISRTYLFMSLSKAGTCRNWCDSGPCEFPLRGEIRGASKSHDRNRNKCTQIAIKTRSVSKDTSRTLPQL
jgi:hypothetical protein